MLTAEVMISLHYEHTPMQNTAILFSHVKIEHFRGFFLFFLFLLKTQVVGTR